MDVTNMVKASAEIVSITSMKEGDVYKRIEGDELRFGVAQTVMNNGEEAAVSVLEIQKSYGTVSIVEKVIKTGTNIAIFPATPLEFEVHLAEIKDHIQRQVRDAQRALKDKQESWSRLNRLERQTRVSGFLNAPETNLSADQPANA